MMPLSNYLQTNPLQGLGGLISNLAGKVGKSFTNLFGKVQLPPGIEYTDHGQGRATISRATPTPVPTPIPTPTPAPEVKGATTQDYDLGPAQESTYSAVFPGFNSNFAREDYINDLILNASKEYNIHPSLLAALFTQESGRFRDDFIYGPEGFGPEGRQDFGIGQINEYWNPQVARDQALDPYFAVPWAAKKVRGDIDYFNGDINRGLAAYNVGRDGASVKGDQPYGGGEKGQAYLDNVGRNLSPEIIQLLGLLLSEE